MSSTRVSHAEAVRKFQRMTGMSPQTMARARITLEPCPCGYPTCNGWIAVGALLNYDGTPVARQ